MPLITGSQTSKPNPEDDAPPLEDGKADDADDDPSSVSRLLLPESKRVTMTREEEYAKDEENDDDSDEEESEGKDEREGGEGRDASGSPRGDKFDEDDEEEEEEEDARESLDDEPEEEEDEGVTTNEKSILPLYSFLLLVHKSISLKRKTHTVLSPPPLIEETERKNRKVKWNKTRNQERTR